MRTDLLKHMPTVTGFNKLEVSDAFNSDIISTIHKNLPEATKQVLSIAKNFKGRNRLQTAQNIWNFLKSQIQYKKDPQGSQLVRLPNRFLKDGTGDCKSYSLFTGAILSALKIPFSFRYTSYVPGSTIPTHIYVITQDENGKQIIIDGVYNRFNAEKQFAYKKDHLMNVFTLSGVEAGGIHQADVIAGVMSEVTPEELSRASRAIELLQNNGGVYGPEDMADIGSLKSAVKKVAAKVKAAPKAIVQAAKKVVAVTKTGALAIPRNSFLGLLKLNFRDYAKKIYARRNDKKLENTWKNLGGDFKKLINAAESGSKRKRIFGPEEAEIGEVATATLIASASAIIAALNQFLGDKPGTQQAAEGPATVDDKNKLVSTLNTAGKIFALGKKSVSTANKVKAMVAKNNQAATPQTQPAQMQVMQSQNFSQSSSPAPFYSAPSREGTQSPAQAAQEAAADESSQTSGLPGWVIPAAIGAGLLLFMKK